MSKPTIFFKSGEHKARFLAAVQKLDKLWDGSKIDQEYGAALYILTIDQWTWESVQEYVSKSGIRFDLILENIHLSTGYAVLIKLAANLFGHLTIHCDPVAFMILDQGNFNVALAALLIRRNVYRMQDFEEYLTSNEENEQ